jgi:hypothetical protein
MPDENTYGFNKDDAQSLLQSISHGEILFPEIRPRGKGGGGTHWIRFTVVNVYCPGDYDHDDELGRWYVDATVDAYSGSCTTAPPGFDEYTETVRIYDTCIFSYYTVGQLQGTENASGLPMSGDAVWLYPFRTGSCVPFWEVKSICGEPSCGNTESPPPEEEE